MPSDPLQTLLNAIPIAEDAHTITNDYHNSLRAAIIGLASQIGGTLTTTDVTTTYAPSFFPVTDAGLKAPEWELSLGIASKPPGNSARGWLPVQLPDGARIKSMNVTGNRTGSVLACNVQLLRQFPGDVDNELNRVPLILVKLKKDFGGRFKLTEQINPTLTEEVRIVDNDRFQYLVTAELTNADKEALVDLYSIQINYER
jgi:hypothetical protein